MYAPPRATASRRRRAGGNVSPIRPSRSARNKRNRGLNLLADMVHRMHDRPADRLGGVVDTAAPQNVKARARCSHRALRFWPSFLRFPCAFVNAARGLADGRARVVNSRYRRVSPVAPRPREGPLTEPTAGAQAWPRERVLMPLNRPCQRDRETAQLGGKPPFVMGAAPSSWPKAGLVRAGLVG